MRSILAGVKLNLYSNFGGLTFMNLYLSIQEHDMSFHSFKSYFMSFNKILWFFLYRFYTFLKCILK